jgi:putative methionine-R-sulfoxide reductase with GAF domain
MRKLDSKRNKPTDSHGKCDIEERLSQIWYLLVGVTVASTMGLAIAMAPILSEQFGTVWPWPNTHLVLLGGLVASIALLVTHLTVQQRHFTEIRGEVQHLEQSSVERERQNQARLKALLSISRLMGAVNNISEVFYGITTACIVVFHAQQASLMLLNTETNELEVRAATGHADAEGVKQARQKIGVGVSGWVAKARRPIILGPGVDMTRYKGLNVGNLDPTAAMVVPVLLRDELVGVLNIRSRDPKFRYTDDDLQALMVFAENVGTVIRHTEHVEWMRKTIQSHHAPDQGAPVS